MNSTLFFFFFIPLLGIILLSVNFIFAPHKPYKEKESTFECGYHSFLGQNRGQFEAAFPVVGILFLIFGVEIFALYPYGLSSSYVGIYGLITMLIFTFILSLGLLFELGNKALTIITKMELNTNIVESNFFTPIANLVKVLTTNIRKLIINMKKRILNPNYYLGMLTWIVVGIIFKYMHDSFLQETFHNLIIPNIKDAITWCVEIGNIEMFKPEESDCYMVLLIPYLFTRGLFISSFMELGLIETHYATMGPKSNDELRPLILKAESNSEESSSTGRESQGNQSQNASGPRSHGPGNASLSQIEVKDPADRITSMTPQDVSQRTSEQLSTDQSRMEDIKSKWRWHKGDLYMNSHMFMKGTNLHDFAKFRECMDTSDKMVSTAGENLQLIAEEKARRISNNNENPSEDSNR